LKTAAAYIRVSTDMQTEFSPESQLKAIREYAKSHDMLLPDEYVFTDEGISGRSDNRPAFQRMIGMAKLKPRPFDVILLWKFSRFARSREDSIVYKSMLRKDCGIDVVSVSEPLNDDKTSVLIEALIEAMDEYYSLNLAEEVRRGLQEKFARGGVVSQPPFGYRMGDGVFVPDETTAPIVKMIFSDFISGMGARQIAEKLNGLGVATSRGNPFENRTVEYVLTNPVYIGKLRRSRVTDKKDRFHEDTENVQYVEGSHEPIITEEIFQQAQECRQELKRLYGKRDRQAPVEYMLKGLVRCSNCGATLTLNARLGLLQCHNYAKGACKVSHGITLKKLNPIVIGKLKTDMENGFADIKIQPQEDFSEKESSVSTLIEKELKKLDRVREAYEAGIDTIEEYKANKSRIQNRIEELKKIIPPAPKDPVKVIAERTKTTMTILDDKTASETVKNLALRSILSRIIFVKPHGTVEIFYKC